jgi:hypothetical protein
MTRPGSKESYYSCLLSFKSFSLPSFISYYVYMLMHFRTIRWSIDVGWTSTWVKIVNEWSSPGYIYRCFFFFFITGNSRVAAFDRF